MKNLIKILSNVILVAMTFSIVACSNQALALNYTETTKSTSANETNANQNNLGTNTNSKVAVIYSSFIGEQYGVGVIDKGNTEIVADMIIEKLGADRIKIEPKNDTYPKTYKDLTDVAKKELNDKARPEIKDVVFNASKYDTIFIGAPVWWGDFPMIMYTFFEKVDLNGKTIVPFSTHAGSGLSGFDSKLRNLYNGSTVTKGLAIYGSDTQNNKNKVQSEVDNWINNIGIAK